MGADTRLDTAREWTDEHRGKILAVVAVLAAIALIVGLTLSWFLTNNSLSTVGKVEGPAELKILGPNETAVEQLDLTYDADSDDASTTDGKVVRRRAFCVESNGSFELQVANTTNINGLDVRVYRAKVNNSSDPNGDVVGRDALNQEYSWSKFSEVVGFAQIEDASAKSNTFGSYENIQKNAQPIYRWKKFEESDLTEKAGTDGKFVTNFIIECSWPKEGNDKETDVAYLIARSTSQSQS